MASIAIYKFDAEFESAEWFIETLKDNNCAFDGEVEISSINLTIINNKQSVSYYSSISFYDKTKTIIDLTVTDVSSWLWSRPPIENNVWGFNLPQYIMNSSYTIHIGSDVKNPLMVFIPFEQWQNTQFLINVIDISSNLTPSYIKINNNEHTVSFNLVSITSVQTVNFIFWAQLIPFYFDQSDLTRLQTANYYWSIEFVNNNWEIKSVNIGSYLVVNKLQKITVEFLDTEGDRVLLKRTDNNLINIFVQQTPNVAL